MYDISRRGGHGCATNDKTGFLHCISYGETFYVDLMVYQDLMQFPGRKNIKYPSTANISII
jgi:hypothetical protein